jgi:hypothetical protein
MDAKDFSELPFLRLDWPLKGGILKTEWVVAKPAPTTYPHIPDGVTVRVRGCDHYEFRDGKVVRKDAYWKIVGKPR